MDASVQFMHAAASCLLVETVDVLRDDTYKLSCFFKFRKLQMRGIGLCFRMQHHIAVKAIKAIRMAHEVGMTEQCFRRQGIAAVIDAVS